MKKTITIIGAGMMGSALAYPAFENGNEVRLVGTPLDRDIIDGCLKDNKNLKFADIKKGSHLPFFYFMNSSISFAICSGVKPKYSKSLFFCLKNQAR